MTSRWRIVEDDRYCGSRLCRRIVIEKDGARISRYGSRSEIMAELRELTGQRRFLGGPAARRASDEFWDQPGLRVARRAGR